MAETDKAETTEAKEFACSVCQDTGTLMLSLTGATGAVSKSVPCTECQGGITLAGDTRDVDQLRKDIQNVAWLVAIALAVAGLALLSSRFKDGTPWSVVTAAREGVE